jgi:hypothetical protein
MKVHLMIITMFTLLPFWGKGQHNYNPTNDVNKLLNYFGHQQALLKNNDSCPECSHIVLLKLSFNNKKLTKALLSHSAPVSFKHVPEDYSIKAVA